MCTPEKPSDSRVYSTLYCKNPLASRGFSLLWDCLHGESHRGAMHNWEIEVIKKKSRTKRDLTRLFALQYGGSPQLFGLRYDCFKWFSFIYDLASVNGGKAINNTMHTDWRYRWCIYWHLIEVKLTNGILVFPSWLPFCPQNNVLHRRLKY